MKSHMATSTKNNENEKEEINKNKSFIAYSKSEEAIYKDNLAHIELTIHIAYYFFKYMDELYDPPKDWTLKYTCKNFKDDYYFITPVGDKFLARLDDEYMTLKVSDEAAGIAASLISLKDVIYEEKVQKKLAKSHYDALYKYAKKHPDENLIFSIFSKYY